MTLLKFYSQSCQPCKALSPLVDKLAKEYDLQVIPVSIDEFPEDAHNWNVRAVPTLILVDKGEGEVARKVGAMSEGMLRSFIINNI